jgi:thiol-disulfide isomerase/thioredoxin
MDRRTLLGVAGLLASGSLLSAPLAGCSSPTAASDDNGFATGDGSFTTVPAGKRETAPVLTGTSLAGAPLSTADSGGKVIVINVWGSWCAPCRHEAPALVAAAAQTSSISAFYGINTRDLDKAPAQAFVRTFKIGWPSFFDPDGQLLLKFTALPPKAIPSTLVIDRKGRIAARFLGEVTTISLVQAVRQIGGETP